LLLRNYIKFRHGRNLRKIIFSPLDRKYLAEKKIKKKKETETKTEPLS
jgi:hypothetical protein